MSEVMALPEVVTFEPRSGSELYGSAAVAAAYCEIRGTYPPPYGTWVHGWKPRYMAAYPEILKEFFALPYMRDIVPKVVWGSHPDNLDYVRSLGWETGGIGLPVVYLPEAAPAREPGSLLVMPVHSDDDDQVGSETYQGLTRSYAEEIRTVRRHFTRVVVCVHGSDIALGRWTAFREMGFEIVAGAHSTDRNALRRIQALLSRFEYVTTNGFGSHLAYGAYFGAKVSIHARFAHFHPEGFQTSPAFVAGNRFLEMLLHLESEPVLHAHYPFLFCHPGEAQERLDWGREEVGQAHKVSPAVLRELFHWTGGDLRRWQLFGRPLEAARVEARRLLPRPVKNALKRALGGGVRTSGSKAS